MPTGDDADALRWPTRILAGALGMAALATCPVLLARAITARPVDYFTAAQGVVGLWLAFLLLRAAWSGVAPRWR